MATASQMENARGCLRKEGWNHADPLPKEERAETSLGDEVHEIAELYQKRGESWSAKSEGEQPPLAWRVYEPALPYVPRPLTCKAEGRFTWVFEGHYFSGREDMTGDAEHLPNRIYPISPLCPFLLDFKTTSKPEYRLDGKGAFLTDPQVLLYAFRRLVLSGASAIYVRWLYLRTPDKNGKGKPKAYVEDAVMSREEVEEAFRRIVIPLADMVNSMYAAAKKRTLNVLRLTPNPNHCYKYGKNHPCPRIKQCNLGATETTDRGFLEDDYMANPENDILALMDMAAANGTTPNPAAAAPAPAPSAPPANPFAPAASVPQTPAATVAMANPFAPPGAAQTASQPPPVPEAAKRQGNGVVNPPESRGEAKAPPAEINSVARGTAPAEVSDAELGRAIRVLFAFLKSL